MSFIVFEIILSLFVFLFKTSNSSISQINFIDFLNIESFLKELESAVNTENYEIAATLRDQIKDLHESSQDNET